MGGVGNQYVTRAQRRSKTTSHTCSPSVLQARPDLVLKRMPLYAPRVGVVQALCVHSMAAATRRRLSYASELWRMACAAPGVRDLLSDLTCCRIEPSVRGRIEAVTSKRGATRPASTSGTLAGSIAARNLGPVLAEVIERLLQLARQAVGRHHLAAHVRTSSTEPTQSAQEHHGGEPGQLQARRPPHSPLYGSVRTSPEGWSCDWGFGGPGCSSTRQGRGMVDGKLQSMMRCKVCA